MEPLKICVYDEIKVVDVVVTEIWTLEPVYIRCQWEPVEQVMGVTTASWPPSMARAPSYVPMGFAWVADYSSLPF